VRVNKMKISFLIWNSNKQQMTFKQQRRELKVELKFIFLTPRL